MLIEKTVKQNTDIHSLLNQSPYREIAAILRDGSENAIHSKSLAKILHVSERQLRQIMEVIRRHGIVVASDENGYYYPNTVPEIVAYLHKEEQRADSINISLNSARLLLQEFTEAVHNGVDQRL